MCLILALYSEVNSYGSDCPLSLEPAVLSEKFSEMHPSLLKNSVL